MSAPERPVSYEEAPNEAPCAGLPPTAAENAHLYMLPSLGAEELSNGPTGIACTAGVSDGCEIAVGSTPIARDVLDTLFLRARSTQNNVVPIGTIDSAALELLGRLNQGLVSATAAMLEYDCRSRNDPDLATASHARERSAALLATAEQAGWRDRDLLESLSGGGCPVELFETLCEAAARHIVAHKLSEAMKRESAASSPEMSGAKHRHVAD